MVDRGLSAGGRVYGYRTVKVETSTGGRSKHAAPARIEIDEREAEMVRRIFRNYVAGESPRAIADTLNREDVPCPGRHRRTGPLRRGWDRFTVRALLSNDRYRGVLVWTVAAS